MEKKKPPARLSLKTLMASSNTSALSTPVFNGENYQVWAVKMKAYLRGLGLWQWVETERQVQPLGVIFIYQLMNEIVCSQKQQSC